MLVGETTTTSDFGEFGQKQVLFLTLENLLSILIPNDWVTTVLSMFPVKYNVLSFFGIVLLDCSFGWSFNW